LLIAAAFIQFTLHQTTEFRIRLLINSLKLLRKSRCFVPAKLAQSFEVFLLFLYFNPESSFLFVEQCQWYVVVVSYDRLIKAARPHAQLGDLAV
jgi:hypothetical protein